MPRKHLQELSGVPSVRSEEEFPHTALQLNYAEGRRLEASGGKCQVSMVLSVLGSGDFRKLLLTSEHCHLLSHEPG